MCREDDVSISYLPLAHMLERLIEVVVALFKRFLVFFVSKQAFACKPLTKSISIPAVNVQHRSPSWVLPRGHFSSYG